MMNNDDQSTGEESAELKPHEVLTANVCVETPRAPRAIIEGGTGLGEAYMVWDAMTERYLPCASEGGHTDFAARNQEETELRRRLHERYARVSVERVVSGMG